MRILKNFFPRFFSINQPKNGFMMKKMKIKFQKILLTKFQMFSKILIFCDFSDRFNNQLMSNDQPNKLL